MQVYGGGERGEMGGRDEGTKERENVSGCVFKDHDTMHLPEVADSNNVCTFFSHANLRAGGIAAPLPSAAAATASPFSRKP